SNGDNPLNFVSHSRGSVHVVLRYPLPLSIHYAEDGLSFGVTLLSGLSEPADSLGVILRYSLALGITIAEVVLSHRVTLVGGFSEPGFCRFEQAEGMEESVLGE